MFVKKTNSCPVKSPILLTLLMGILKLRLLLGKGGFSKLNLGLFSAIFCGVTTAGCCSIISCSIFFLEHPLIIIFESSQNIEEVED